MVLPGQFYCARCGRSWETYYPRVTCPCGHDTLKRMGWFYGPSQPSLVVEVIQPTSDWQPMWSPYPMGNGTEGAHA